MASLAEQFEQKGRTKGLEEGLAKGKMEGLAKGLEKGKMEGRLEGRLEGKMEEKYAIAKNLLMLGALDEKAIAEATHLPLAEVKKIRKMLLH